MIYSGCLILRAQLDDAHRRARLSAVLAILGALDVPLVIVAAHWFRGIHPATAAMEPAMRTVLWLSVAGFTALFTVVLACRRSQLQLQAILESREQQVVEPGGSEGERDAACDSEEACDDDICRSVLDRLARHDPISCAVGARQRRTARLARTSTCRASRPARSQPTGPRTMLLTLVLLAGIDPGGRSARRRRRASKAPWSAPPTSRRWPAPR